MRSCLYCGRGLPKPPEPGVPPGATAEAALATAMNNYPNSGHVTLTLEQARLILAKLEEDREYREQLHEALDRLPLKRSLIQVNADGNEYRITNEAGSETWERTPWEAHADLAVLAWDKKKREG